MPLSHYCNRDWERLVLSPNEKDTFRSNRTDSGLCVWFLRTVQVGVRYLYSYSGFLNRFLMWLDDMEKNPVVIEGLGEVDRKLLLDSMIDAYLKLA